MELFFMMTAMLALLGPIAAGRIRCIHFTPRLQHLFSFASDSRAERSSATSWVARRMHCNLVPSPWPNFCLSLWA
jgi:hypothetical protein